MLDQDFLVLTVVPNIEALIEDAVEESEAVRARLSFIKGISAGRPASEIYISHRRGRE